jgi:arsenate reductase
MELVIYHNPRCSKSRQTLALLTERGFEPSVVEYLKTPPDRDTIERLLTLLELEPRALMRQQEAVYRERGLDDPGLDRASLVAALADEPRLLQRPIVVRDQRRAVIGRPPEKVLELLT